MKIFKKLKNLIKEKRKNKYHDKVNVICDTNAHYIAHVLENMFTKLNCNVVYFGANVMYVDTPYVYMKIKFVNNYRVDLQVRGHKDELFISSYLVEDIVETYKPKKAFKRMFKKEAE